MVPTVSRILICDFDFFSTVGGGQVFYRRLVERNPGLSFFYPSRGPDLVLEADGRVPGNARPFMIGDTAAQEVLHVLGDSVPDMTRHHARLLAEIAVAVQGQAFDVVDLPSFFPAAHLVRPIFTCFGVTAERVVLSMLGWNSVSCRASYDDLSEVAAGIEAQEIACADAADIRYTISHLEQSLQRRGDLPVLQVDMHDFIEEFPLPQAAPPGSGAPDLWFVGRLDGAKGPDIFIELAARMPRHLYGRCLLSGPDNVWEAGNRWSTHVLGLARERGVDAAWLGVLTDAEVRQRAYQGRSVVVVPSRTDSFNYVALEAVLNGCPVLLSSQTGASGFLASEHPDLLPPIMDPHDLEESAAQLSAILEDYTNVAGRLRHRLRNDPFVRPRRDTMADIYMAAPERTAEADRRAAELTGLLRAPIPLMSEAAVASRHVPVAGTPRPRVSIVIPTFDRPQLLAPTLASLARQSLQDFEVIVVDDESRDGAAIKRLVDSYAPWARLKRVGNGGEAGAVNRGLEEARGEFVGFLSDDDAFHPHLLEQAVLALEQCPEALGIYPDWEIVDTAGAAVELHRLPAFDRRLMLRAHWCLPSVGAIVRRSAVTAIGGRDITFRFVSDFDFWLRLTAHGPLLHIPRKLAYWRLHQANLTNSSRRREMADERIRLVDRLFADPEEEVRSALDRRTAYAAAHLCAAALLNRSDDARALHHLSSAAELDGDLCRDLPPNMTDYPPCWPDGYQQALGS